MLNFNEKTSVLYHDLFDYPLNLSDLIKWQLARIPAINQNIDVVNERGFYFLKGRRGLIYKRFLRRRISAKKMKIAKRASGILSLLPGVRMVAVTGSLAMQNSSEKSDIDLMIVTRSGSLWTTRFLSYFLLSVMRFALRRPNDDNQKDKLCLNMWIDENDIIWPQRDRNLYTAHEIAQIVPLVNKDKMYEEFLFQNKWILSYWPSAVVIKKLKIEKTQVKIGLLERIAYNIQLNHMKLKVTREVITPTRALFHPQDWGKIILGRLSP